MGAGGSNSQLPRWVQRSYEYILKSIDGTYIDTAQRIPEIFTGIVVGCGIEAGRTWYFHNGKVHRLDGHAYEAVNGRKYWYIDGRQITKEQCELLHSIMTLKGLL